MVERPPKATQSLLVVHSNCVWQVLLLKKLSTIASMSKNNPCNKSPTAIIRTKQLFISALSFFSLVVLTSPWVRANMFKIVEPAPNTHATKRSIE